MTPDMVEDLPPAKVPILPKDILNSRKAQAVRKEQKRKQGKQRSLGPPMDYSPLPIDKHEPEFVRIPHNTGSIILLLLGQCSCVDPPLFCRFLTWLNLQCMTGA